MTATVTVEAGVNYPDSDPATFDGLNVSDLLATALSTGAISEATAAAGIAVNHLMFLAGLGTAAGEAAIGFGMTKAEGMQLKVIEELLDLTDLGATSLALTTAIPAGSVILCTQANIEATVVAGGTTVKVALGLAAGDVDKYGISANLVKNTKIDKIPDWAVLSGSEAIALCGVVTNGSALGDSNITAGSVRARVLYFQPISLANAA